MIRKFFVISLMLMILSTTILFFNGFDTVKGATTTLVNWENFNIGANTGEDSFINFTRTAGDDFTIANFDDLGTGSKTLYIDGSTIGGSNDAGYIQLLDSYSYIKSITILFDIDFSGSGAVYDLITFKNGTTDVLKLGMGGNSKKIGYYDALDVWHELDTKPGADMWGYKLVMTHSTGNSFNYSLYNYTTDVLEGSADDSSNSVNDWVTFTNITFVFDYYTILYIDDIIITVGTEEGVDYDEIPPGYEDNDLACGIHGVMPILGYCDHLIGDDGTCKESDCQSFLDTYYYAKYIEIRDPTKLDVTIHRVDIKVAGIQRSQISSSLTDYRLWINGVSAGNPSAWIDTGDGSYLLSWQPTNPVNLDDEMPLFEFESKQYWNDPTWGRIYWQMHVLPHLCGLNAKKHDSIGNLGDGELDGVCIDSQEFFQTGGDYNCVAPYIKYYYTIDGLVDILDLISDDIIVNVKENNKAYISATVINEGSSIHIYNTDTNTEITDQSFPKYPFGAGSFNYLYVSQTIGNYNATIQRNGVNVSSYDFNISAVSGQFDIWTNPYVTEVGETTTIYYKYDPTVGGDDGKIVISVNEDANNSAYIYNTFFIENSSNVQTITTAMSGVEPLHYVFLMRYITGLGWKVEDTWIHTVKSGDAMRNRIWFTSFLLPAWNGIDPYPALVPMVVNYEHTHLGDENIWITVNDVFYEHLKYSETGSFTFVPTKETNYIWNITLSDGVTNLVLASENFTAYMPEEEVEPDPILPQLETRVGAIVGLIITLFCLLSPLLVTRGLKSKQGVPAFAYAITGSIGIGVSVMLGFFPFWIIPFIVAVGVIVATFVYLYGKKGEGD